MKDYWDEEKNGKYNDMPCPVCGKNMFNRWIRDVKAKICHECEDRQELLKKDLKYIKSGNPKFRNK